MKANENLMVGDWVKFKGSDLYHQVKVVSNKSIKFDNQKWFAKSSVEPIPLTPEILEKNGMHLYNRKTNNLMEECNHSDVFEEDDNYRVELSLDYDGSIRWTINGDEDTIMPFDYVHQLQQALRLCEIEKEIIL